MKFILSLLILGFSLNSFASDLECVDSATAEKALAFFIGNDDYSIYFQSTEEYFYNEVSYEGEENPMDYIEWLADFQNKAAKDLQWNAEENLYSTGAVWSYECAPSASCWGGFVVDCEGGVSSWFEGEE
jgi:hypothetical protein